MKIGLAGFGFGGKYFHAPLIASAPGVEFAGVVTKSPERQAEVAELYPGVPTFASLADLKAAGAQAVAISTPADTHIPLVHEAIELGLSVVSDKPFALKREDALGAVEAAEKAGVKLSVYQNRRWDSDLLTVKKLVETGELGSVHRFQSRFERFEPTTRPPAAGGGILHDFGSHLVDQALYLFGPAASVYAEQNGELDFFVAIKHVNGVSSHLIGSWLEGAPGPRYRVTGSSGSFVLEKPMEGQEHQLLQGLNPQTAGDAWGVEPESDWGRLYRADEPTAVPTERGSWDTYYPAFAAAVRGEGPVPVDPRDAVASTEVLDAARTSAATGQVVTL
ncbi:Gfo/Idh/MocA family oxidoreductase [Kineosporia succinea]